jgi:hypothetical protein
MIRSTSDRHFEWSIISLSIVQMQMGSDTDRQTRWSERIDATQPIEASEHRSDQTMMHGCIASLEPIIDFWMVKIDQNDASRAGGLLIVSLGRRMWSNKKGMTNSNYLFQILSIGFRTFVPSVILPSYLIGTSGIVEGNLDGPDGDRSMIGQKVIFSTEWMSSATNPENRTQNLLCVRQKS